MHIDDEDVAAESAVGGLREVGSEVEDDCSQESPGMPGEAFQRRSQVE